MLLSRILGIVQRSSDLSNAFKVYDEIRRPRANKLVETSKECGEIYTLKGQGCGADRQKVVDNLNQRWLWIWTHDLDADVRRAEMMFTKVTGATSAKCGTP